jgi:hypothetical protein
MITVRVPTTQLERAHAEQHYGLLLHRLLLRRRLRRGLLLQGRLLLLTAPRSMD